MGSAKDGVGRMPRHQHAANLRTDLLEFHKSVETIPVWQTEVDHQQIGFEIRRTVEGGFTAAHHPNFSGALEEILAQIFGEDFLVFDDQDPGLGCHRLTRTVSAT
ncbi:MAG: hypothetical protein MZW92_11180 [Comamonadaceae bacterium]|nr:hypothetical protein [Comamonadaceae bacterium]